MASKKRIAALHAILSADIAAYKSEMKAASALTRSTEADIKSSFASLSASTNASFAALQQKQRATFAAMRTNAAGLRSDTATAARGISADIAAMTAGMTKQLNAVNFGKALLSGFGIGSAIQILDMVGQKFVAIWKDAEIHAKAVEERAKSIHDVMGRISAVNLATVDARRTPEQRIAARKSEMDSIMAQMQALDKRRSDSLDNIRFAREQSTGVFGGLTRFNKTLQGEPVAEENNSPRAFSDMMAKRADDAQLAWSELALKLSEVRKELEDLNREQDKTLSASAKAAQESAKKADDDAFKKMAPEIRERLLGPSDREREQRLERAKELNRLMKDGADIAASVRTPLEQYNASISRLNDLRAVGAIDADIYDRATRVEGETFQKAKEQAGAYAGTLAELEEPMDKFAKESAAMWENIADRASQSLASMAFDSEAKFSDMLGSLSRMIAETALRMAIINPIMNGMFGLKGSSAMPALWSFGGARADGGPVQAGKMYMVGEEGPEPFIPSTSGTIIPNHQLSAAGGGGGDIYNVDMRGASVEAVMRLEQLVRHQQATLRPQVLGIVADARKRGGGEGRSLGS